MTDLWTPSDELLNNDPIAKAKVANPHPSSDFAEAGIILPDALDDEKNSALAAVSETQFCEDGDLDGTGEDGTADDGDDEKNDDPA